MPSIKTVNLTRKFGDLIAVNNLNIEVAEGEIFGLVGPDGAGKTTTMRLLTGIMDPTSGEAWVYNRHTVKEAELLKDNIGYMSQRFGLYEDLTVMENINFYADIYCVKPGSKRDEKIKELLGFSGLTPFKDRLAGKLSGGDDLRKICGPRDAGNPDWMIGGIEGPFVFKRDGYYFMFFSAWTRGYEIGLLRATTPLGPWELNKKK